MKESTQYDFSEVREECLRWAVYRAGITDIELGKITRFIMSSEFNDEALALYKNSETTEQYQDALTNLLLSSLLPKSYVN